MSNEGTCEHSMIRFNIFEYWTRLPENIESHIRQIRRHLKVIVDKVRRTARELGYTDVSVKAPGLSFLGEQGKQTAAYCTVRGRYPVGSVDPHNNLTKFIESLQKITVNRFCT